MYSYCVGSYLVIKDVKSFNYFAIIQIYKAEMYSEPPMIALKAVVSPGKVNRSNTQ